MATFTAEDLRIHGSTGSLLSGGATGQDQTDPNKFLGGRPSLFSDVPANSNPQSIDLDNVFASVPGDESLVGSEKYRCLYVMNMNPTVKVNHIYVWITKTTTAQDDEIFLGIEVLNGRTLEI